MTAFLTYLFLILLYGGISAVVLAIIYLIGSGIALLATGIAIIFKRLYRLING